MAGLDPRLSSDLIQALLVTEAKLDEIAPPGTKKRQVCDALRATYDTRNKTSAWRLAVAATLGNPFREDDLDKIRRHFK